MGEGNTGFGHLFAWLWALVWPRKARAGSTDAQGAEGRGRSRVGERDLDGIALYHRSRLAREGGHAIDDRTWRDLDLDEVFAFLDHCASPVGQQVLYHRLRTPAQTVAPLSRLDALVEALPTGSAARAARRQLLRKLDSPSALLLPWLFLHPLPGRTRARFLYPVLTATTFALLLGAAFVHALLLPVGGFLLVNTILHLVQHRRLSNYLAPLSLVSRLIATGVQVERAGWVELERWFPSLPDDLRALAPLRRASTWLAQGAADGDDLGALVRQYLNAFFLLEPNALARSLSDLRDQAPALGRVFEALGELDLADSIAVARAGGGWSRPEFLAADAKRIELLDARHPLLEPAVPNSLTGVGSVVITGSNMAGKSTFLRTVGVNVVLAQTVFTSFSASYRAPMLQVCSAMGQSDSLVEGKSYYLAELERIRGFFAPSPTPRLFLLDELFRGTNATERIAAGCAVLRQLDAGAELVMVATHDLELVELLRDGFRPFHFRELIEGASLHFDYRLQPGPSSTRNAIALLEVVGFPPQVVAEALQVVERLEPSAPKVGRSG